MPHAYLQPSPELNAEERVKTYFQDVLTKNAAKFISLPIQYPLFGSRPVRP